MPDNERVETLLEELLTWTKFMARRELASILDTVLKDPKHFHAYKLSDGTRSQSEIGKLCGLSQSRISGLHNDWKRMGLVRERSNRMVHLISPDDLGLLPAADES